jgi:hypothetical protein
MNGTQEKRMLEYVQNVNRPIGIKQKLTPGNPSVDITGQQFGQLTAIKKINSVKWLYRCDCGNEKIIFKNNVTRGLTRSCGCFKSKKISLCKKIHGRSKGDKTYRAWCHMISRCENKHVERYQYYGGRGIKVCSRWRNSFENFLKDMGQPPTPQHTLGRQNNDGHYEPNNCLWETKLQQSRNKSNTVLSESLVKQIRADLNVSGAEWGRMIGCSKELINQVKRGKIWL